jgi:FkbM family methyltransferase
MDIWKTWDNLTNIYEVKKYDKKDTYNGSEFFYNEIYNWEFSETKCIYEMKDCLVQNNDIVVDLGSNIGFFTRYAAEKLNTTVISIEGSPELFSCLVENNSDLNNIYFLNAKIISENNRNPSHVWTNRMIPINVTIKDIFYLYDLDYIDFLKIDIEGCEYDIFEDLNEKYLKKIKKIVIETHDKTMNEKLSKNILKDDNKKLFTFDWYYNSSSKSPQTMFYFYNSF